MIAKRVVERKKGGSLKGKVIGEEESLRDLGWMDQAREMVSLMILSWKS